MTMSICLYNGLFLNLNNNNNCMGKGRLLYG